MIDFVLNFKFNTWLALGLYWLPLVLCLIGYSVRTWKEYQDDIVKINTARATNSSYSFCGDLTIGSVIGRILATTIPGLNLLCLVFSIGYGMIRTITEFIGDFFSISLAGSYKAKKA